MSVILEIFETNSTVSLEILETNKIVSLEIFNSGTQGDDGRDAYQVAVEDGGFVGTEIEWLATLQGPKGDAFVYEDFTAPQLEDLKGGTGGQGIQGIQGPQGESGADGNDGNDGIDGTNGTDGLQGAQGIQGIQGLQGPQGITTDVIAIYMSTGTENLTAGDKEPVGAPYDFTLNSFWIWVKTAPTGSSLVADLKKAGVSVTTTKASIDANEFSSLTGIAPILTGNLTFAKGSKLTPNLTQPGSLETGKNLIMYLEVTKI